MSNNVLDNYVAKTADWRKSLRQNNFRTLIVIFLFFFIYASIGMIADMYIGAATYPSATLSQLFFSLITFKLFPLITLIMLGIAGISLLVSYALYDKLMLLGTNYHEITPESRNIEEQQLYNVVEEMKIAAGLRYMPKVYI